jgi:hypothetical protein
MRPSSKQVVINKRRSRHFHQKRRFICRQEAAEFGDLTLPRAGHTAGDVPGNVVFGGDRTQVSQTTIAAVPPAMRFSWGIPGCRFIAVQDTSSQLLKSAISLIQNSTGINECNGDITPIIGGSGIPSQGARQQVCRLSSQVQTSSCLLCRPRSRRDLTWSVLLLEYSLLSHPA